MCQGPADPKETTNPPPCAAGRGAGAPTAARAAGRARWCSQQLFGADNEIEITHGGTSYRLRITRLGKLILTK